MSRENFPQFFFTFAEWKRKSNKKVIILQKENRFKKLMWEKISRKIPAKVSMIVFQLNFLFGKSIFNWFFRVFRLFKNPKKPKINLCFPINMKFKNRLFFSKTFLNFPTIKNLNLFFFLDGERGVISGEIYWMCWSRDNLYLFFAG